jgi:hypothetical protein
VTSEARTELRPEASRDAIFSDRIRAGRFADDLVTVTRENSPTRPTVDFLEIPKIEDFSLDRTDRRRRSTSYGLHIGRIWRTLFRRFHGRFHNHCSFDSIHRPPRDERGSDADGVASCAWGTVGVTVVSPGAVWGLRYMKAPALLPLHLVDVVTSCSWSAAARSRARGHAETYGFAHAPVCTVYSRQTKRCRVSVSAARPRVALGLL